MTLHRSFRLLLVATVSSALLALAGCASTVPGSASHSPSPSATSSHGPDKTVVPVTTAKIQIDGTGLTVIGSDGSQLARILYSSDATASVATLAQKIGSTPTTTSSAAGACAPAQTVADWGGSFRVTWYTDPSEQAGAQFVVRADAASLTGISIQTPQGFHVGDLPSVMAAGTPNSLVEAGGEQVWYDLDGQQEGALAQADSPTTPILFLYAPAYVNQDC